jgi:hypothetical protein
MQVRQDIELIRPSRGAAWNRLNRFLIVISILAVTFPLRSAGESAVLDGLKETLASRWEFQKSFPLAARAFAHRLDESDAATLAAQLRAPADTLAAPNPEREMWRRFALGLAAERLKPESGEADLSRAGAEARGNIAVNFEMARILEADGLYVRARVFGDEALRSLLAQGYLRSPDLAKLELWRARGELAGGNPMAARQSLDFAGRLDPLCPWVPWLALEIKLRESPPWRWDLGAAWESLAETFRQLRYYDSQNLFLLNVSRMLRWGLGIFALACLAAFAARHFHRIAHPLAERLPQQVELRIRYLAVGLIPLSLWVGGGGYAVLGLVAAAMLWKHASRQERSVLKAALTGLAALPVLLLWEHALCRHLDVRLGVSLYHKAYARGYEKALAEKTEAFRPAGGEDSLYKVLAASLQYKKQGNYIKAGEKSREALALSPENPIALIGAANLSLVAFDFPKALAVYERAGAANPGMTEAWFNASQAALYANKSDRHKRFLDRAADLDADWVTNFLKANDDHFPVIPDNRKTMDAMLRPGAAWTAALSSLANLEFAAIPVSTGLMQVPAAWLLAAVLLTGLGLFLRFRRYSHNIQGRDLFECKICGKIMCRTCRKGVHCQDCFKTVAGVQENRVRFELITKLKARAAAGPRRLALAMNLVFPGTGGLFQGSTRLLRPLLVSLALGAAVGMNDLLMEYPAFVLGPLRWLVWIPVAVLYAAFGFGHLIAARRGVAAAASGAAVKERVAA